MIFCYQAVLNIHRFSENQPKAKGGWSTAAGMIRRVCRRGDAPGGRVIKEAGPRATAGPPQPHSLSRSPWQVLCEAWMPHGGDCRGVGERSSLLPTCPPPRSSTWGPSIQFPGGTWWSFSEGSHHVCFLRGLWVGRLQRGARGALHTRGTCSVLSGRCCAGRGGWAVAGPLGPRGALQGERGRAKLGPAGRLTGKVFSPPLWPQPWPQGSEQEACPSAAALQAGAISGASATLLTARGAAQSHAQEASPCHSPSGLEMETEWAAGMVGRHGSQRGHRHPERRRLRLGFTEGHAVQGRKEAPRPAGRLWGSQGDFRFLFAGLVCPRPPPPPPAPRSPLWGSEPGLWWLRLFQ